MTPPFAKLLRQALDHRGITASDLARRIWGSEPGGGACNRQSVSHYLAGRSRPQLATIERIATALQIPVTDLVPSLGPADRVAIEATIEDNKVRLKIDRAVDHETAMKIIGMLSA